MIAVGKENLKFLRAGRTILVPNDGKHRKGRVYKLRVGTQRKATLDVQIVAIEGEQLRIRLATEDKPHLLAAHSEYGYTDDPARAMRGEPEAISEFDLKRYAEEARVRNETANASWRTRSIAIRLKEVSKNWDPTEIAVLGGELLSLAAAAGGTITATA